MDVSSIKFIDSNKLIYKKNLFKFCVPLRDRSLLYKCVYETCNAKIRLDRRKTKIMTGEFQHSEHKPVENTNKDKTSNVQTIKNNDPDSIDTSNKTTVKNGKPSRKVDTVKENIVSGQSNMCKHGISVATQTEYNDHNEWDYQKKRLESLIDYKNMEIDSLLNKIELLENHVQNIFLNAQLCAPIQQKHTPILDQNHHSQKVEPNNVTYHIIGDSHVRGLRDKLAPLLPKNYGINTFFQPGAGFQGVAYAQRKSPSLINPSPGDPVIIICGTNDIFTTPWDIMQNSLKVLLDKFSSSHLVCLVGIPYRYDNRKQNFHIGRLNSKINNYIKSKKYQQVVLLNPNKFLKPKDFAVDGVHLNKAGKSKLAHKIKVITDRSDPPHIARPTQISKDYPINLHRTLVPIDPVSHLDEVPTVENLISFDESAFPLDPPIFSDTTVYHAVSAGPMESLLDTPNLPEHVNHLLHKENQPAMKDYYRLTRLSHSFTNAVHSSPLPALSPGQSQQQTPVIGRPIETVHGYRPAYDRQDFVATGQTQET